MLCVSIINCRGCPIGLIRYELHPMLLFCVMKERERNKHVYPYSCKYLVYIISCFKYVHTILLQYVHNLCIISSPIYSTLSHPPP